MKPLTFIISGVSIIFILFLVLIFTSQKNMNPTANHNPAVQSELKFESTIYIGNTQFKSAIANDNKTRERGLSGHPKLEDDQAMVFSFVNSERKRPGFWMKEMLFPIDIIWVRENIVVDISKNVPAPEPGTPLNDLPLFYPKEPIDTVIEINTGLSDKLNIKTGTTVRGL